MEYASILVLMLVALAPLIYFGYQDLIAKNSVAQATAAVRQISSTVDQLRAQGPGSRLIIQVSIPENVESSSVLGREIMFKVRTQGGLLTDVYQATNSNLTGSLPTTPGVYSINITVLGNGTIWVAPAT